jgi:hypothetical protein
MIILDYLSEPSRMQSSGFLKERGRRVRQKFEDSLLLALNIVERATSQRMLEKAMRQILVNNLL